MSKPADTTELHKALELIAGESHKLHLSARSLLEEINCTGVAEVAGALGEAAIRAGMSPGRSYDYSEEYAELIDKLKRKLEEAIELLGHAETASAVATDIANVVPKRCPRAERYVLVLT